MRRGRCGRQWPAGRDRACAVADGEAHDAAANYARADDRRRLELSSTIATADAVSVESEPPSMEDAYDNAQHGHATTSAETQ